MRSAFAAAIALKPLVCGSGSVLIIVSAIVAVVVLDAH